MGNQLNKAWTSIKQLASSDKVEPVEEEKREIDVVPNALPTLDVPNKYKNQRRRVSVSAEVDQEAADAFVKKVIPKSEDAVRRIRLAVSSSFLFGGLTPEHTQQVIDAMEERKVQPGDVIIKQGDPGDFFYIIDSGRFDVFKKLPSGEEKKIFEYTDKGSFGELALMYNCPRAATVKATSEGVLWALDRSSFKFIVITGMAKTKNLYQKFLEGVPLFENLTAKERATIADCLQPISYDDGATVIHQGEVGDKFYLIETGEAIAYQKDEESGEEVLVGKMGPGQYFGERALITNQPRAATVKASGSLRLASMDRGAFERLLGDCRVVMQRHMSNYESAQQVRARNMSLSLTDADRRSTNELNQPDMSVTIPHSESDDGRRDSISISATGPPGHIRLISTGDIQPPTPVRPGSASVVSVTAAPPAADPPADALPGAHDES